MAGTWTSQNKILPGAYVNFRTNKALSITVGERGIVVLLQEMSVGTAGEKYEITATDSSQYPKGTLEEEKILVNEALKGSKKVILYNLGAAHTAEVITEALAVLKTEEFNTICYPYDAANYSANQAAIVAWVKAMREQEGVKIQAVLADCAADSEGIINVVQGIQLSNGTTLTSAQATAWVAGISAGANVNQSNTAKAYMDAIDVVPRMTKTEMEEGISSGKFLFKVDSAQNVTVVYDVNSLTSFTVEKSNLYRKNRVIRTIDSINKDINEIFESNYIGKMDNNADGRSLLRATLIEYFNELQALSAIQNFTSEDITISAGTDSDAVIIDCYIQPVDSVEKIYITVNLA